MEVVGEGGGHLLVIRTWKRGFGTCAKASYGRTTILRWIWGWERGGGGDGVVLFG